MPFSSPTVPDLSKGFRSPNAAPVGSGKVRGRPDPLRVLGKWDTGFPPGLAREVIDAFAPPGAALLDPFGESPTPMAQGLAAGHSVAVVARNVRNWALLSAAASAAEGRRIVKRIVELRNDMFYGDSSRLGPSIQALADQATLSRLVHLRDNLDLTRKTDVAIAALICHLLDHGPLGPPESDGAGDVFDALLELARATFPWNGDDCHRPRRAKAPNAHVWRFGAGQRLGREIRLARLIKPRLVLGQLPIFHEKRASTEPLQVDWRLQVPPPAKQIALMARIGDIPGYLRLMTLVIETLLGAVESGTVLALWIADGRLKGRKDGPIPLAERLATRLEEASGSSRVLDLATPGAGAAGGRRAGGRLLVMQKRLK